MKRLLIFALLPLLLVACEPTSVEDDEVEEPVNELLIPEGFLPYEGIAWGDSYEDVKANMDKIATLDKIDGNSSCDIYVYKMAGNTGDVYWIFDYVYGVFDTMVYLLVANSDDDRDAQFDEIYDALGMDEYKYNAQYDEWRKRYTYTDILVMGTPANEHMGISGVSTHITYYRRRK